MKIKIFILLLLSSCTTKYIVSSKNCKTHKTSIDQINNPDFILEKRIWAPVSYEGHYEIDLSKQLEEKLLSCKDFEKISFTLENGFIDGLINFVPFVSSKRMIIKGNKRSSHEGE